MAYTSVIPVRRLDRAVKYVMNKEKTTAVSLQDALDYAANRDKTEQSCFESSYACTLETAFADMRQTKEQWHKSGGVQGYHLVQSLPQARSPPNWRIKSQRNWQTACWVGSMNMSSVRT